MLCHLNVVCALQAVLDANRGVALEGLRTALGPLNVGGAAKELTGLKITCEELGLGRKGAEGAGAALRALLTAALAGDGCLRPASAIAQAQVSGHAMLLACMVPGGGTASLLCLHVSASRLAAVPPGSLRLCIHGLHRALLLKHRHLQQHKFHNGPLSRV